LFAAACTASHQGCETVWNTDVRYLFRDLIAATLSTERLQSFCRFWFLCYQQRIHACRLHWQQWSQNTTKHWALDV